MGEEERDRVLAVCPAARGWPTASTCSAARTLPQVLAIGPRARPVRAADAARRGRPARAAGSDGLGLADRRLGRGRRADAGPARGQWPAGPARPTQPPSPTAIERLIQRRRSAPAADRDGQSGGARPHRRLARPEDRARAGQDGRHPPAAGDSGESERPTPQPPPPCTGKGSEESLPSPRAGRGLGGRGSIRVAIPLAGFNLSGGVKSLVGVANALADAGTRRPHPGP